MRDRNEELLRVAIDAAKAGGSVLTKILGRTTTRNKGYANPVTEADIESQRAVVALLRSRFPDHGIIAEESDLSHQAQADFVWYVDPLDGTANYSRGFPHFCVSIGCAQGGAVVAGVVLDPSRDELFVATRGAGAQRNGKPMTASTCATLDKMVCATGCFYDRGPLVKKTLGTLQKLYDEGMADMRRTGSAVLDMCWLACGRIDAYFEYELGLWDKAAASLIAAEAGALVYNRDGEPFSLDGHGMLACGPGLGEVFRELAMYR